MSEFVYYTIRQATIDGAPFEPEDGPLELTIRCHVVPMGDGTPESPKQLEVLDWGGPRKVER